MSTFNTTELAGSRVLVTGQDDNLAQRSTILDASQWEEIQAVKQRFVDGQEMDVAIKAFYAPLSAKADEIKARQKAINTGFEPIVIKAGVAGREAVPAIEVVPTKDTEVLRLLSEGRTDRLVWVGDTIEVLR